MKIPKLGTIKKIVGAIQEFKGIEKYLPSSRISPSSTPVSSGSSTQSQSSVCSRCIGHHGDHMNKRSFADQLKPEVCFKVEYLIHLLLHCLL